MEARLKEGKYLMHINLNVFRKDIMPNKPSYFSMWLAITATFFCASANAQNTNLMEPMEDYIDTNGVSVNNKNYIRVRCAASLSMFSVRMEEHLRSNPDDSLMRERRERAVTLSRKFVDLAISRHFLNNSRQFERDQAAEYILDWYSYVFQAYFDDYNHFEKAVGLAHEALIYKDLWICFELGGSLPEQ